MNDQRDNKRGGFLSRILGGRAQPRIDPSQALSIGEDEKPVAAAETLDGSLAPDRRTRETTGHDQPALIDAKTGSDEALRDDDDIKPAPSVSWFQRLRSGLTRTSSKLNDGIVGLFTKRRLDEQTLEDLEDLLIQADLGLDMATRIAAAVGKGRYDRTVTPDEVRGIMAREIEAVLSSVARPLPFPSPTDQLPRVILIVGVNGSGKTTTIGKLTRFYTDQGKTVMLAAGDTFRAAAVEQLKIWGQRTGCEVMARETGADAAGLAFDAIKKARENKIDIVLIDTAGRLQNKADLMGELEKIVRVIKKIDADAPHNVLLVLDATTGQNAISQVDVFKQKVGVNGLIMTKLDGTAKGGILVALASKFGLPIHAIGVGEGIDDLQSFNASEFARAIAGLG